MPTLQEDYTKAQVRAKEAGQKSMEYGTTATSLQGMVMDAVRADRTQRGVSQLATDVGTTLGQIPTDTAGIRQRAGDMVNPMDVDVLTASQRGQNLQTLGTIAEQQQYNQGTIMEILGEHAASLKAIAEQKYYEAQQAETESQNLFKQMGFNEDVRQFEKTFAEGVRRFDIQEARKGKKEEEKEERPMFTPTTGDGTVSPGGDWVFYNGNWLSEDDIALLGFMYDVEIKKKKSEKEEEEIDWGNL